MSDRSCTCDVSFKIHKLAEKMGQQRQFMNHQGRKLQDQANHESISKVVSEMLVSHSTC